jgi:hypothetical protein
MGQGREAETVRQLVLVIVLVGASFLGGAFVNGPGLQWIQTKVLRSLGLNNKGEIASVDLKSTASSEVSFSGSAPAKPEADAIDGLPAPIPSPLTESILPKHDASDRHSVVQTGPKSTDSDSALSRSQPSPLSPSAKRLGAPAKSPSRALIPSDIGVTPASAAFPSTPKSSHSIPDTTPAIIDSLAALLPLNPSSYDSPLPPSSSTSLPLTSTPKSIADGSDSWLILERKMQSLGVSRYTMDGEPGGPVVFSCLIPLAGREAVAQRFEAEGDDLVHAVQAALRRIILWQATQPSLP